MPSGRRSTRQRCARTYTASKLASITPATQRGRAAMRIAPTRAQSVPRVAKYRQAKETPMPAIKPSVARRQILPARAARPALFPARGAGEGVADLPPAHELPQPGAGYQAAGDDQELAGRLPGRVQPETEAQHEKQESDGSPDPAAGVRRIVVHGNRSASARA